MIDVCLSRTGNLTSGIGKRAGRPEVVTVRSRIILGYKFGYTHQLSCLRQVTVKYGGEGTYAYAQLPPITVSIKTYGVRGKLKNP